MYIRSLPTPRSAAVRSREAYRDDSSPFPTHPVGTCSAVKLYDTLQTTALQHEHANPQVDGFFPRYVPNAGASKPVATAVATQRLLLPCPPKGPRPPHIKPNPDYVRARREAKTLNQPILGSLLTQIESVAERLHFLSKRHS